MSHAHNRPQTRAEEIVNSALHGTGMLLSIAAIPVLVLTTVCHFVAVLWHSAPRVA